MNETPCLVADIGGTYSRFAIVLDSSSVLVEQRVFINSRFSSLEAVLDRYLKDWQGSPPRRACLAVAGPILDNTVRLTNVDWTFSNEAIRRHFGFEEVELLNDFAALACALDRLCSIDLSTLKSGIPVKYATRVVLGPGTGFGAAASVWSGHHWCPVSGEAGHMAFAPGNTEERAVLDWIWREQRHVSVETLICGRGLLTLYQALGAIQGRPTGMDDPTEVTRAALEGSDELAHNTVHMFTGILAGIAGDLALLYGARGGVYLGGGIASEIQAYLRQPVFSERFLAKRVMQEYLGNIPVYLITHPQPTLLGGATWISHSLKQPRMATRKAT